MSDTSSANGRFIQHLGGGFPHSEITGSKGALASPVLIAECHVFHRLLPPRHPPDALLTLDRYLKSMCSGKRIREPPHGSRSDMLVSCRLTLWMIALRQSFYRLKQPSQTQWVERHGCRINLSLTMTNIPELAPETDVLLSIVVAP